MTRRRRNVGRQREAKAEAPAAPVAVAATWERPVVVAVCVLLVAVVVAAYVNAGHRDFLFDSGPAIETRHTRDLGGRALALIRRPFDPGSQVTYFTFALNYKLNKALGLDGFDTTTFLIGNVAVHALNAVLVFFLIDRKSVV